MHAANVTASPGDGGWAGMATAGYLVTLDVLNLTFSDNLTELTPWTRGLNLRPGRGHFVLPPGLDSVQAVREFFNQIMPAALSIGILGNVLAAFVFMLTPLKKNPLSHYLTALAIAEMINEVACLVLWVTLNGWDIYNKVGVCQVTTFSHYMSRFLVVWYLLAAHFERLFIHFGRPGTKRWCTVFRTKCVILSVFIFSLVAFLHHVWSHVVTTLHADRMTCRPMAESVPHIQRLRKVEVVLALFLPMLVILGMDVALVYKVTTRTLQRRSRRTSSTRLSLRSQGGNPSRSSTKYSPPSENGQVTVFTTPPGGKEKGQPMERDSKRVREARTLDLSTEKTGSTLVCVLTGLIYIGLTLPSACLGAWASFAPSVEGRPPLPVYEIHLMTVFDQVAQLSGVYKVFLYGCVLRNFRRALLYLCKACFKKTRAARPRPAVTTV